MKLYVIALIDDFIREETWTQKARESMELVKSSYARKQITNIEAIRSIIAIRDSQFDDSGKLIQQ